MNYWHFMKKNKTLSRKSMLILEERTDRISNSMLIAKGYILLSIF